MTGNSQRLTPLVIFTVIIAVISFFLKEVLHVWFVHTTWMYLILFLSLQAVVTLLIASLGTRQGGNQLILNYMLAVGLRFVLSVLVVYLVLKSNIGDTTLFVVNFFVLYFLYVAFEIYVLITNLRPNSEKRI